METTARPPLPDQQEPPPSTPPAGSAEPRRDAERSARIVGDVVFAAAGVATFAYLLVLGNGLTFFYDEWDFIDAPGGFWGQDVLPHNGHPSMLFFGLYRVLLDVFGLHSYWPFFVTLVLLDVLCGWLLYCLLRRRIHPVIAAAAAAVLMLLGPAWQDLLWAFQMAWLASVAGGLAALWFVDRDSRRSDVGAAACLVGSVGFSAVALAFIFGLTAELLWRRQWRRLWVTLAPLGAFLVWYVAEDRGQGKATFPGLRSAWHLVTQAFATTTGALVGHDTLAGGVVAVALSALAVVAVVRSPARAGRLVMAAVGLGSFWALTLLARGATLPLASRYVYPGAVLVLVGAAELPGLIVRPPSGAHAPRTTGRRAIPPAVVHGAEVGLVAVAGLVLWWNTAPLTAGQTGLAGVAAQVKAELGAAQAAGSTVPPAFRPEPLFAPQVLMGPYRRAVRSYGSPALTVPQLRGSSEVVRAMADLTVLHAVPIVLAPLRRGPAPNGSCAPPEALDHEHPLTFALGPRGDEIVASSDLGVGARSFASVFSPIGRTGTPATIVHWPASATSTLHWQIRLSVPSGVIARAQVCAVHGS